jgi:hypothetical protein
MAKEALQELVSRGDWSVKEDADKAIALSLTLRAEEGAAVLHVRVLYARAQIESKRTHNDEAMLRLVKLATRALTTLEWPRRARGDWVTFFNLGTWLYPRGDGVAAILSTQIEGNETWATPDLAACCLVIVSRMLVDEAKGPGRGPGRRWGWLLEVSSFPPETEALLARATASLGAINAVVRTSKSHCPHKGRPACPANLPVALAEVQSWLCSPSPPLPSAYADATVIGSPSTCIDYAGPVGAGRSD